MRGDFLLQIELRNQLEALGYQLVHRMHLQAISGDANLLFGLLRLDSIVKSSNVLGVFAVMILIRAQALLV